MPWYLYYPNRIFSLAIQTLQKNTTAGAYCSVFCATMDIDSDETNGGEHEECYFVNSKIQPLEKMALNKEDATQLWDLSCKLVGLDAAKEKSQEQ